MYVGLIAVEHGECHGDMDKRPTNVNDFPAILVALP